MSARIDLERVRTLAGSADHAFPSGHAHYMPEPCGEVLAEWLYPLAEAALALVEAVEAARETLLFGTTDDHMRRGDRFREALARFDFGEPA